MITEGEKNLYEWQYQMSGSFFTHLFDAIVKADSHNMYRLSLAFPEEVEAFNRYRNEDGYWHNLQNEYKNDNK